MSYKFSYGIKQACKVLWQFSSKVLELVIQILKWMDGHDKSNMSPPEISQMTLFHMCNFFKGTHLYVYCMILLKCSHPCVYCSLFKWDHQYVHTYALDEVISVLSHQYVHTYALDEVISVLSHQYVHTYALDEVISVLSIHCLTQLSIAFKVLHETREKWDNFSYKYFHKVMLVHRWSVDFDLPIMELENLTEFQH